MTPDALCIGLAIGIILIIVFSEVINSGIEDIDDEDRFGGK